MTEVDFTGAQGGALAMAFAAGCAATASVMTIIGGFIWRFFGDARIKELQAARQQDQDRCDVELALMRARVSQLEGVLLAHGPRALRDELQAKIEAAAEIEASISGAQIHAANGAHGAAQTFSLVGTIGDAK